MRIKNGPKDIMTQTQDKKLLVQKSQLHSKMEKKLPKNKELLMLILMAQDRSKEKTI